MRRDKDKFNLILTLLVEQLIEVKLRLLFN